LAQARSEKDLLLQAAEERVSRLTLMITTHHFNLVKRYLKTFKLPANYPGDKSDLLQVGLIGVIKALDTHDPEKSSIATWSWYWIRSEIRSEVNRLTRRIQLDEEPENRMKDSVLISQMLSMIERDKDKQVLLRSLLGQTNKEIGDDWGISRQAIQQRLHRAYDDIRRNVNEDRRRFHKGRRILFKANAKNKLDRSVAC